MNKFIYEDTLSCDGYDWYDVCYPIETEMSKDDLISYLQLKAESFSKDNPKEDIFCPFGDDDYQMSVSSLLGLKSLNTRVIIFPIEQWKGITV